MISRILCVAAAASLAGCTSFSWSSNKSVNGNSTGGIVPATVTSESEQMELANKHCAQYSRQVRVTARPQDTGGKLIFVCEAPGTPPPPDADPNKPPPWKLPSGDDLPPDARVKKRNQ